MTINPRIVHNTKDLLSFLHFDSNPSEQQPMNKDNLNSGKDFKRKNRNAVLPTLQLVQTRMGFKMVSVRLQTSQVLAWSFEKSEPGWTRSELVSGNIRTLVGLESVSLTRGCCWEESLSLSLVAFIFKTPSIEEEKNK